MQKLNRHNIIIIFLIIIVFFVFINLRELDRDSGESLGNEAFQTQEKQSLNEKSCTLNHLTILELPTGEEPGMLNLPRNLHPPLPPFTVDKNGNIYLADAHNKRILKFSPTGTLLWTISDKHLRKKILFLKKEGRTLTTRLELKVDDVNQLLYVKIHWSTGLLGADGLLRYSSINGHYKDTVFENLKKWGLDKYNDEYIIAKMIGVDRSGNFWIRLEQELDSPYEIGPTLIDIKITPKGKVIEEKRHYLTAGDWKMKERFIKIDDKGNFYTYIHRNIFDCEPSMGVQLWRKYSSQWEKIKEIIFHYPLEDTQQLGIDNAGNHYLFKNPPNVSPSLEKYNEDGVFLKSMSLPIRSSSRASIELDDKGNIYIGWIDSEKNVWRLQRYCFAD